MNVEILCITDRSGSMRRIRDEVVEGYNAFLGEQKRQPGDARITNVQFASDYDLLSQAEPLQTAHALSLESYVPGGGTALLDAIGRTLDEQGKRIATEKWADIVIVYITTDGAENGSRRYTHAHVKAMIEHAQMHGWTFIFLAANQDAFSVGETYGIAPCATRNFVASAEGTQEAYAYASAMTTSLRAGA